MGWPPNDPPLEGHRHLGVRSYTERTNTKKVKLAAKKRHGRLFCEVCGFDFEQRYGDLGQDFCEAHAARAATTSLSSLLSAGKGKGMGTLGNTTRATLAYRRKG
jgi:hypothetical protein